MEAKLMFRILMLTGFLWNSMSRPGSDDQFASLLRTAADDHMGDVNGFPPNSLISGPNGYCIDIKKGKIRDETPIILWDCKPGQVNQQWTVGSDGTIRVKGKYCLTTTGNVPGSEIILYYCHDDLESVNVWEFTNGGTIRYPGSRLVITAFPPNAGTKLTLEPNIFSSHQTWQVRNYTGPRLASIIGLNGLCLQETDDNVWITACDSTNELQKWYLYSDGSIRPKLKTNGCLSYASLSYPIVAVIPCWLGPSSQRWLYFTASRTFWAERVNLYLDVKDSDPSLKQIIVSIRKNQPSQKWEIKDLA